MCQIHGAQIRRRPQRKAKARALSGLGLRADAAAVSRHDALDRGQTNARAGEFGGGVQPLEGAKQAARVGHVKTHTVVAHHIENFPVSLGFSAKVDARLRLVLGSLLGIALAIAIVHVKFLAKSLMPWIIASQTIPILAIAPMVIVVLGSIGFTGLVPKSLISMYLCFFPVTIGMVKGLTSPETMQLDLMRTYNANTSQLLWKLRFPASIPYLVPAMKVSAAAADGR